jgi:hypothetical protein
MKKNLIRGALISLASYDTKPKTIAIAVSKPFMVDESMGLSGLILRAIKSHTKEATTTPGNTTNNKKASIQNCLILSMDTPSLKI